MHIATTVYGRWIGYYTSKYSIRFTFIYVRDGVFIVNNNHGILCVCMVHLYIWNFTINLFFQITQFLHFVSARSLQSAKYNGGIIITPLVRCYIYIYDGGYKFLFIKFIIYWQVLLANIFIVYLRSLSIS